MAATGAPPNEETLFTYSPRGPPPAFFIQSPRSLPSDYSTIPEALPPSFSSKGAALLTEAQERNWAYTTLADSGLAPKMTPLGAPMVSSTAGRPTAVPPKVSPPKSVKSALPAPLYNHHPSALTTGSIDRGPSALPSHVAPGAPSSTTVARDRFAHASRSFFATPVPSNGMPRNTGRPLTGGMIIRDFETAFGTNPSSSRLFGANESLVGHINGHVSHGPPNMGLLEPTAPGQSQASSGLYFLNV